MSDSKLKPNIVLFGIDSLRAVVMSRFILLVAVTFFLSTARAFTLTDDQEPKYSPIHILQASGKEVVRFFRRSFLICIPVYVQSLQPLCDPTNAQQNATRMRLRFARRLILVPR